MPKETPEFLLAGLALNPESAAPMYRQLYDFLRQAILEGRLLPGQRLPATRVFAAELGVSRNTVMLAFDALLSEGYLQGKMGSGTYVTGTLPDKLLQATQPSSQVSAPPSPRHFLSKRGQAIAGIPVGAVSTPEAIRPFQHGLPAVFDFPFDIWARIAARVLRWMPYHSLGYGEAAGYYPLREAIADYLRTARAVRCDAEQIIIVNGSQQALDLAARVLLDPGETAWVEDPGYFGAKRAFAGAGVEIIPVPLDAEGLDVERGRELDSGARLIYVTPSHQYPLGVTMSLARRLQLLEWANQSAAWILEDDYDSEYRYSGRPLSSLQGLDQHGRVIYLGTFSKVLFPALRIGYLAVPENLANAFIAAKSVSDRHNPLLEQMVLAKFMEEGHFTRHIRRMRVLYQERRQALVRAAEAELKGLLAIQPSDAGMHVIGLFPESADDRAAARRAAEFKITANPLSAYYLEKPGRAGLVLGYSAFNEREITAAVRRLARALTG